MSLTKLYKSKAGISLGLDVGATSIKTVALRDGKVRGRVDSTWDTDTHDISQLLKRLIFLTRSASKTLPRVDSIGISWSTIISPHDGKAIPARYWSAVDNSDLAKINHLRNLVIQNFPYVNVEFQNDGNMSAFAFHVLESVFDTLVIDIGTDVTAGYIRSNGEVAFEMPLELGLIQIQFSLTSAGSGTLNDLASGAALERLLSGPLGHLPSAAKTKSIAAAVAQPVTDAIKIANLPAKRIRLCGGVISRDTGRAIVTEIAKRLGEHYEVDSPKVFKSRFAAALGAAHFANARRQGFYMNLP